MKNLLIYVNPKKTWDTDNDELYNTQSLVELQLDTALDFWQPDDIILATNFSYEYRGVKNTRVHKDLFCRHNHRATKINVIIQLILDGKLNDDCIWFHDIDAFQIRPLTYDLKKDLACCTYGFKSMWNTGSFFFNPSTSLDIFDDVKDKLYEMKSGEEPALTMLTKINYRGIRNRIETLNNTYNVGMTEFEKVLAVTELPVKVVHFPPHWSGLLEMFEPILTERFISQVYSKFPNVKQI